MLYRVKLGTIPYANLLTTAPFKKGDVFFIADTNSFKTLKPTFRKYCYHINGKIRVRVCQIDKDVAFLERT